MKQEEKAITGISKRKAKGVLKELYDKGLLLKYLCAALPYRVKVHYAKHP